MMQDNGRNENKTHNSIIRYNENMKMIPLLEFCDTLSYDLKSTN